MKIQFSMGEKKNKMDYDCIILSSNDFVTCPNYDLKVELCLIRKESGGSSKWGDSLFSVISAF